MLIISKTSKKKIIVYIIIIILMFSGTGYFLYKNFAPVGSTDEPELSEADLAEMEKFEKLMQEGAKMATSTEPKKIIKEEIKEEASQDKENNAKDNPYYISIFDNPRFKFLEDNSVSSSSPPVGKENPFIPN